jgi:hypothetical protein
VLLVAINPAKRFGLYPRKRTISPARTRILWRSIPIVG